MSSSVVVVVVLVLVLVVVVGGNVCLTVVVVGFLVLRFGDVDFLGFGFEVVVVVVVPPGDARRMSLGSAAKNSEPFSSSLSSVTRSRSRSNPGSAAYTVLSAMPRRATAYEG